MNRNRYQQVKRVFERVSDCPPVELAAALDEACNGDAALRREVESLLSHARAPAIDFDAAAVRLGDLLIEGGAMPVPKRIGDYEICHAIGEGGMGVVYLGRQSSPEREVAIKVLRPGLATDGTVRRFRYEAQALARMQHPGIARIYDAGTTESAFGPQPFLVMEYVAGVPITDFARERALSVEQRLRLVIGVCEAVQHAHQRGVIHRDLKPANILVDSEGAAKVLDFGVARETDADDSAARSVKTISGQLLGTISYMSPEQVSGRTDLIDTRSDVYSLGAVCFELLTGELPHETGNRDLLQAARHIEQTPARTLSSVNRAYRGDLDIIVARAIHLEPDRRYRSPAEFAADLKRFLDHEPIDARRDSMLYVLGKQVRRHRPVAALLSVLLVGLIAFALYAGVQAKRFNVLAEKESTAKDAAVTAQEQAEANASRAAAASEQAGAVTTFLVEMLGMADPDVSLTTEISALELLQEHAGRIDEHFRGQPAAEAQIRTGLGLAFYGHGQLEHAYEQLHRALELHEEVLHSPDDVIYEVLWPYTNVLEGLQLYTWNERRWNTADAAIDLWDGRRDEIANSRQLWTDSTTQAYTDEQSLDFYQAFRSKIDALMTMDDPRWIYVTDFLVHRAVRFYEYGRPAMAAFHLREALAIYRRLLPETNSRVVRAQGLLVRYTRQSGDAAEAARLGYESLETLSSLLPDDHWYMAMNRVWIGRALHEQGRVDEAATMLADALPHVIAGRGIASVYAQEALLAIVAATTVLGRDADAARYRARLAESLAGGLRRTAWQGVQAAFGPDHADVVAAMQRMIDEVATPSDDLTDAIESLRAVRRRDLAADDPLAALVADVLTEYGERYANQSPAIPWDTRRMQLRMMFDEAVAIGLASPTRHPRKNAVSLWWLGVNHEAAGEYVAGERFARQAVEIMQGETVTDWGMLANAKAVLGGCLFRQDRFEEAELYLREGFEGLREIIGVNDTNTSNARRRLIDLLLEMDQTHDAAPLLHEQLVVAQRMQWTRIPILVQILARDDLPVTLYEQVISDMDAVLTQQPESHNEMVIRALALHRCGRSEDSAAVLDAFTAKPVDIQARLHVDLLLLLARIRSEN